MNVVAFVVLDEKEKTKFFQMKRTGKCPLHFKELEWLNLCEGGCADGCVQPGDGRRCWEIVEGERRIPWHIPFSKDFGKITLERQADG